MTIDPEVKRIASELYAKHWNAYVPKTAAADWFPAECLRAAQAFVDYANKREAKNDR